MYLDKFVHSTTGKYMMSILLGIGLACIFRTVCKGTECHILTAPSLTELENNIYTYDNKCYTFEKKGVECNKNKKIIKL
jgi:hypothetical protein